MSESREALVYNEERKNMEDENEDEVEEKEFTPRPSAATFFIPFDHFPPPTPHVGTSSMETATDKEEEEKAKEVSKEGNASSSSTPLKETATETEGSEKTTVKPSRQGNVDLPFKKLTNHDDIILESEPGDSSKGASQKPQDTEIFLFEVKLTRSDVEEGRLSIPVGRAIQHFPPMASVRPNFEQQIEIYDTDNEDWKMTLTYNRREDTFEITKGWEGFVDWHGLESADVIRFYKPFPRLHNRHYLIKFIEGEEPEIEYIHEFKQENFLFQLQLTPDDIGDGILVIPKGDVRNHFPGVNIPAGTNKIERLTFTDTQNADWCVKMVFDGVFVVADGWDEFVKEHNLEAMDVIKFYKPVRPLHERHFLIECVKREAAAGTSQTQLGGAKNGGSGGIGTNRGGRRKGGRGGSSHGGGSSGKGKTMCCWTWTNQSGGQKRAVMILEEV